MEATKMIVHRGEVYRVDLNPTYGYEQGGICFGVIVQNDIGNIYSDTTIIVPLTTSEIKLKKSLPVHITFNMTIKNIIDYDKSVIGDATNVALAEQLRVIDKKRLIQYLGTISPKIMEELDEVLKISLNLK